MALYYDLLTFTQGEMGAKKIKRQDFIIEVSAFFIIFYPNRYQLFLLTFDTLFQFHHSYKKFENRLLASTKFKNLKPFSKKIVKFLFIYILRIIIFEDYL